MLSAKISEYTLNIFKPRNRN